MPDPGRLSGSTPMQWGGGALVPQRAGGRALEFDGDAAITALVPVPPGPQEGTHTIFARDYLFADGKSLIQLGTAGLLPTHWGTVLRIDDDDNVDVQVEESDWGRVLAVGLVARRADVSIRTRLLRTIRKPQPGDRFQFDGSFYVVIHTGRSASTRTVRELTVTGARWHDLNGAAVTHQGVIAGGPANHFLTHTNPTIQMSQPITPPPYPSAPSSAQWPPQQLPPQPYAPDFVAAAQQAGHGGVPPHLMGPPSHQYLPQPQGYESSYQLPAAPVVRVMKPPAAAPAFNPAAALQQLQTLETFQAAVDQARAQGGPTAALQALLQKPLQIGTFTLQKVSLFTFLFLQNIKSPYVAGGSATALDIAKAMLAFTDPEQAGTYLSFEGEEATVDFPSLTRDAYRLAALLDGPGVQTASDWITGQVGGVERMLEAGKEEANFPTAAETMPPPKTATTPAPPVGSSSSSISS